MKYMILLFNEERPENNAPDAWGEWMAFGEAASKIGTIDSAAALQPAATATTVSVRDEKLVLTDGPFVDTKELLGGYYVFDCANLDDAIKIASMTPWAKTGHIEVRPVLEGPEA